MRKTLEAIFYGELEAILWLSCFSFLKGKQQAGNAP